MAYAYIVPQWFFGISIGLEILFALAAFFVAYYSYKVSRLYKQRSILLMASGFAFVALSYISKAAINIFLLREIQGGMLAISLPDLNNLAASGFYLYISLYLLGLIILAYMTFRTDNTDLFLMLVAITGIGLWLSFDKILAFSILSSVMLCMISIYYGREYGRNRNKRTLWIFLGFVGLLLSGIGFTFASGYYLNYVIGHLLELASYVLILASIFSLIIRK